MILMGLIILLIVTATSLVFIANIRNFEGEYNIKAQVLSVIDIKKNADEVYRKANNLLSLLDEASKEVDNIPLIVFPVSDKNLVPLKNLLIVYNSENPESLTLKDYYIDNRPGFKSANVIGIRYSIPDSCADSDCLEKTIEYMHKDAFRLAVRKPILSWISSHPEKEIKHVVLMRGIPSKLIYSFIEDDAYGSVQHALFRSFSSMGAQILITSLDMGSVESTKAYISKIRDTHNKMLQPHLVISAKDTGKVGDTYYFEDAQARLGLNNSYSEDGALGRKEELIKKNPEAKVEYRGPGEKHFNSAKNVLGYMTWGENANWGGNYMLNGSVRFSGNSGWYLIDTLESYNGAWTSGPKAGEHFQGNFIKWFSRNAFGGNNYENTPVAAVTSVEEPGLRGKNKPELFSCWDRGNIFIDCAWSTSRTPFFQAIGDPWVTK